MTEKLTKKQMLLTLTFKENSKVTQIITTLITWVKETKMKSVYNLPVEM